MFVGASVGVLVRVSVGALEGTAAGVSVGTAGGVLLGVADGTLVPVSVGMVVGDSVGTCNGVGVSVEVADRVVVDAVDVAVLVGAGRALVAVEIGTAVLVAVAVPVIEDVGEGGLVVVKDVAELEAESEGELVGVAGNEPTERARGVEVLVSVGGRTTGLRSRSRSLAPCSAILREPVDAPGLVLPGRSSMEGGPTASISPCSVSCTGSEIHCPRSSGGNRSLKPLTCTRTRSGSPLRSSVQSMSESSSGQPCAQSTVPSISTSRPRVTD